MPNGEPVTGEQTPDENRPTGEAFEPVDPVSPGSRANVVPSDRWSREIVPTQTAYRGPLTPATLREFNEIEPGLAREIIQISKAEADHRREIEKRESEAAIQIALKEADAQLEEMRRGYAEARIGQVCALTIGLALTAAATYAGVHQAQITGSLLGAGGLTAIITAFIYGRPSPRKPETPAARPHSPGRP